MVIADHHHVVQSSGLRLYFMVNVGFFIVLGFLFLVYYFDASFLTQKARLTCKSNFFQLIFLVIVEYCG